MPELEAEYTDKVSVALEDLYTCARVWEAWQYGTMTDADFSLANEDPDVIENVMAVVRPLLTQVNLLTTALKDAKDEVNGLLDSMDDSVIADENERLAVYDGILAVFKSIDADEQAAKEAIS